MFERYITAERVDGPVESAPVVKKDSAASKQVDILIEVYSSLRAELAQRWTMLYQLGGLAFTLLSAAVLAAWIVESDKNPTALGQASFVALLFLVGLAVIFVGETTWMAHMHFACRQIEKELAGRTDTNGWLAPGSLYWHHRFGGVLRNFPGAKILGAGALALFGASAGVLSYLASRYWANSPCALPLGVLVGIVAVLVLGLIIYLGIGRGREAALP